MFTRLHELTGYANPSDLHAGFAYSQPSAFNTFYRIAYEEYGVRPFFHPGDLTTGVQGYRGQEFDLVPALCRTRKNSLKVTEGQLYLADQYIPRLDGVTNYVLGGNHDYWHVVNSGIDVVATG